MASGTYLDRLLVKGAQVLRAGILTPRQLPVGLQGDHSLVMVDIEVRPTPAVPLSESQACPAPLLGRRFLLAGGERRRRRATTKGSTGPSLRR